MSERQQLALIRHMEEEGRESSDPSPPSPRSRTPLGLLTPNSRRSGSNSSGTRTPQEERELKKIGKRNPLGETPLHQAAKKGNIHLMRKLLR